MEIFRGPPKLMDDNFVKDWEGQPWTTCHLCIKARLFGGSFGDLYYDLWDGTSWQGATFFASYNSTNYETKSKDVTNKLNTTAKVNAARLALRVTHAIQVTYAYLVLKKADGETYATLQITVFTPSIRGWVEIGTEPWLDTDDGDTNSIRSPDDGSPHIHSYWDFQDVSEEEGPNLITDGEIATLSASGPPESWVSSKKEISGSPSTNVYTKAIVRARRKTANAKWSIAVQYSDASSDSLPWQDNAEFATVTLALTTNKTISRIFIYCQTTNGNPAEAEFDYVAICKDTLLVPVDETKSDIVESLTITLPLLSRGVGGFSCKLPNVNGEYTGKITDFDHILIYLWRKGASMKKVFGGKILLPGTEGYGSSQEYYLLLSGMDIGQELLVPPNLMKKVYEAVNGKTIIEEAIDLSDEVTKKFVDVDNEIASTHDFEFQEVIPHSVIEEVCKVAKTLAGAVGFDGYVDPAGNMHVFKRGKYTSGVSLAERIEHYKKEDDVHRIRNKIKVYGAAERAYPLDKDAWTETLTPADGSWASGTGTGSVSFDTAEKILGTGSIKLTVGGSDYYGRLIFTLNDEKEANCYDVPDGYADITFQIKLQEAYSGDITLLLFDDAGMECSKELNAKKKEWVLINIPCGRAAKDQWTYSVFNSQPFNWKKVKKVDITCHFPATGTGAFWIDNLFFNKRRFEGFAEDATSQEKYGVRWKEPIIDDGLKSDAECLKKAESYRDFLKEKVITLTDFEVEGDNEFKPGDKQQVVISNDNIDEYFRILEVRHVVKGVNWSTFLTLTNEPQFIDYVFMSIDERLKRLEKRAGISIGAGGGGGGGAGPLYLEEKSLAFNTKTGVAPGTETTIVSYDVGNGETVTLKGFIGWGTCPAIYTLYSGEAKKASFMTSEAYRTANVKMEEKITGPKTIALKALHYTPAAGPDDYHNFEGTLLGS